MNISSAQHIHIRLITGMVRLLGSSVAYSKRVGLPRQDSDLPNIKLNILPEKSLIVFQSHQKKMFCGFLDGTPPKFRK